MVRIAKYIAFVFIINCTTAGTPNVNVTVPLGLKTEQTALIEEAKPTTLQKEDLTKLPNYHATVLMKGSSAPENGLLISPRHAAEAALDAAEAKRLTVENQVLVNTKDKEIALYEKHQERLEKDLESCKKQSWWDKNGTSTMFGLGIATGILTSLAIFKTAVKISE